MITGRKPQEGSVNRNKPVTEWTDVENIPFTSPKGKPKMPRTWEKLFFDRETGQHEYVDIAIPSQAKEWWATHSSMPHCILWTPSDWAFFKATFFVAVAAFAGETKLYAELRQREAKMGITASDRISLRIRYIEPALSSADIPSDASASGASIARRERLLGS